MRGAPLGITTQVAAERIGIPICRGIVNGSYCGDPVTSGMDHRRGFVRDGTIHYATDRVFLNRPTLRKLCLLAADVEQDYDQMPPWEARWRRCTRAEQIARERVRVRLPSSYWNLDRWTVKAQLSAVPTDDPRRAPAMAWANLARRV